MFHGGHDSVEAAHLHGGKQTIEVAKPLRQRRTREAIGGRGRRCVHGALYFCWIIDLPLVASRSNLTTTRRGSPDRVGQTKRCNSGFAARACIAEFAGCSFCCQPGLPCCAFSLLITLRPLRTTTQLPHHRTSSRASIALSILPVVEAPGRAAPPAPPDSAMPIMRLAQASCARHHRVWRLELPTSLSDSFRTQRIVRLFLRSRQWDLATQDGDWSAPRAVCRSDVCGPGRSRAAQ
jgi:hypothetical protein